MSSTSASLGRVPGSPPGHDEAAQSRMWRQRLVMAGRKVRVAIGRDRAAVAAAITGDEQHAILVRVLAAALSSSVRGTLVVRDARRRQPNRHEAGTVIVDAALEADPPGSGRSAPDSLILTVWRVGDDGSMRQLAGAIVPFEGTEVSWATIDGLVHVQPLPFTATTPPRWTELRHGDIVAGDPRVTLLNVGGNRTIVDLLVQELACIYELEASEPWRAALLVPLELAGGAVYSLGGAARCALAEMEAVLGAEDGLRLVAPYVAVSHPRAFATFRALVREGLL
jgi:hypothetical protein